MKSFNLEQYRRRLHNLRRAREEIKIYTRELRINNYLPGQIMYYLGDYPAPMSITPTDYDYNLLKSYAENGVDMIQVHEEWNDTINHFGSDKWHSCDHKGMLKFVDLCHYFGIKIIPYCSAGYIDRFCKEYDPRFSLERSTCVDLHYHYVAGWGGSEHWLNFIIPRTFEVMDTYGFDGIYNDWGYDFGESGYVKIPENRRNYENKPLEEYDPEAEDLVHMIYEGVKKRGGIYKVHAGGNNRPPVRGKYYDYLWIGEGEITADCGAGKMFEPYMVPCPHKMRLTDGGKIKFDYDAYFSATVPFVQFPLLTHGRPSMGQCIDVPGVPQYNKDDPYGLYPFYSKVREFAKTHPNGPYTYSEWSSVPDDPNDYTTWCKYLSLYKPMVQDDTIAYMEVRETDKVLSQIPQEVYITLFETDEEYMVASNMTDSPYIIELRDKWINRETNKVGSAFTIPPKRMVFLRSIADNE